MAQWIFEQPPPMGGPSGEAYRNTLNAGSMPLEHVLGREALQNSTDARDQTSQEPVFVRFSSVTLDGKELESFATDLGLYDFRPRLHQLDLPEENAIASLDHAEGTLPLLIVEDWNTTGLSGSITNDTPQSHFRNLLLKIGFADKARSEQATGGSYGFGKAVYSNASDIRTIVAYSVFEPSQESDGEWARLMACAYLADHEWEGRTYTGRAWFGRTTDDSETVVLPYVNEQAQYWAEKLGFSVRQRDEVGTSIMIVGCDLDINVLREGVELFWWPRMVANQLAVEIYSEGTQQQPPRPKLNQDLLPFIECYSIAQDLQPVAEGSKELRFQRYRNTDLGRGVVRRIEYEDSADINHDDLLVNSIALVRGPKMVVEYNRDLASQQLEPVHGVFVAHSDIEVATKLSEPGLHNKWDPTSVRLSEEQKDLLKTLLTRLRKAVRRFQQSLTPPPPKARGRVHELQRYLGRALGDRDFVPPPPVPTNPDPIMMQFVEYVQRTENGTAWIEAEVKFKLKETSNEETMNVQVRFDTRFLIDDNHHADSLKVPLSLVEPSGLSQSDDHDGMKVDIELSNSSFTHMKLKSDEFAAGLACELLVHVEPANA